MWTIHRAADALSQLKRDEPIKRPGKRISWCSASSAPAAPPPKGRSEGFRDEILWVTEGKEGVQLPEVHPLATLNEGRNKLRLILAQAFIHELSKYSYGRQREYTVGFPGPTYILIKNGFLMRPVPIDRAVQKDFTTSLRARLLNQSHYPSLGCHPSEKGICNKRQRK